ncbi:OadG family transporter subunit [Persicobacter psychrovividus]|uniref:Oxaloacetate decarboxylase gamma chain n=1 Tax=Persicobacter psychrovividus TaxID=387638 RepID=A0ABM7VKX9_9BACT|nr:hypothetical protein PEPS_39010 [Persicobacter psychrovividus]
MLLQEVTQAANDFAAAHPLEEGWIILSVGMLIIFLALLLLFVVFGFVLPGILNLLARKPKVKMKVKAADGVTDKEVAMSGEVAAAISAGIYQFLEEAHDEENTILTIDKVKRNYSPWSSKIYTTHSNQLAR